MKRREEVSNKLCEASVRHIVFRPKMIALSGRN